MSPRRAVLTLMLFAVSVALGVAIHVAIATPPAQIDRFPSMNVGAPEPAVTADLARAIVAQDAQGLAASYPADLLGEFQTAMEPVVGVDDIRYIGGIERDGEILASYAATGVTQQGESMISGFVIHVREGKIVGFN